MIQVLRILLNDHRNKFSEHLSPHSYKIFFLGLRTSKIYPLSNFEIRNTVLLTLVKIFRWKLT